METFFLEMCGACALIASVATCRGRLKKLLDVSAFFVLLIPFGIVVKESGGEATSDALLPLFLLLFAFLGILADTGVLPSKESGVPASGAVFWVTVDKSVSLRKIAKAIGRVGGTVMYVYPISHAIVFSGPEESADNVYELVGVEGVEDVREADES